MTLPSFYLIIFLQILYINCKFYLGIDFGSEFIKASIFNADTKEIIMVENLQSKIKSNNILAILNEERLYGYEALSKQVKYPTKSFAFLNDYINKETTLLDTDLKDYIPNIFNRYEIINGKFSFSYEGKIYSLSLSGLIAMQLRFIKKMTEKHIDKDVNIKGVLLSIPYSLNYEKREILKIAFNLANMNLIGFVEENEAAIYSYAYDYYQYLNKPEEIVLLLNSGSSNTQISLFSLIRNKKKIKINNLYYDNIRIGGRNLDFSIKKLIEDKLKNTINEIKIHPFTVKYKEILSSNKEVNFNIPEGKGKISKDEFDHEIKNTIKKIIAAIENLINYIKHLNIKINSIELIGGNSRVPLLVSEINSLLLVDTVKENFDKETNVGTHINSDDSVAKGAANLSYAIMKSIEMKSNFLYSPFIVNTSLLKKSKISLDIYSINEHNQNNSNNSESISISKDYTLLDKYNTHNIQSALKLNFLSNQDVIINVKEDDFLYEQIEIKDLTFHFNDLKMKNITCNIMLELEFKLNYFSEIILNESNAFCEFPNYLTFNLNKQIPLNITNQILNTKEDKRVNFGWTPIKTEKLSEHEINLLMKEVFDDSIELNTTQLTKQEEHFYNMTLFNFKSVGNTKQQKINLPIKNSMKIINSVKPEEIKEDKLILDTLDDLDLSREERFEKRNNLEALLYEISEYLKNDDNKSNENLNISKEFKETFSWFEEYGLYSDIASLEAKLKSLLNLYQPIKTQKEKLNEKAFLFDKLETLIKIQNNKIDKYIIEKPWIKYYISTSLTKMIKEAQDWIKENNLTLSNSNVDIVIKELKTKINLIESKVSYLLSIQKPKEINFSENIKVKDLIRQKYSDSNDTDLLKLLE